MADTWSIWKDFGYPGTVVVPGEKGPLAYTFTRDDFARMVANGNAKLRDCWNVPVCWEHQNVGPEKLRLSRTRSERERDFARGVFSRIAEFALTPDGRGKVRVVGDDPDDLKQLKKVGFVSPEIVWDWSDSDGKVWRGPSVTHLAATPRPVQRLQHPFGANPDLPPPAPVADLEGVLRCSLGVSPRLRSQNRPTAALRLSLDHYREKPMADELFPSGDDDADDAKSGEGGDKGKGGKKNAWQRIADALLEHAGIDLGDVKDVKDEDTFAMVVEVAARNYSAGQDPEPDLDEEVPPEEEDMPPPGDMPAPPMGATEPPPPVQMSLKAQTALAETHARNNLQAEIDRLVARRQVSPAIAAKLLGQAKTVRLSFTAQGQLAANEVTTKIAAYKELPPNAAWSPKQPGVKGKNKGGKKTRLSLKAVEPDLGDSGPADDDRVVEEYEAMVGRSSGE
jgi:hypothetical protein